MNTEDTQGEGGAGPQSVGARWKAGALPRPPPCEHQWAPRQERLKEVLPVDVWAHTVLASCVDNTAATGRKCHCLPGTRRGTHGQGHATGNTLKRLRKRSRSLCPRAVGCLAPTCGTRARGSARGVCVQSARGQARTCGNTHFCTLCSAPVWWMRSAYVVSTSSSAKRKDVKTITSDNLHEGSLEMRLLMRCLIKKHLNFYSCSSSNSPVLWGTGM